MSRRSKGFTLVELLIVIVVIAILAAITIVAYSGITSRANDSTVQSNLADIGQKMQLYATLNGDLFPAATDAGLSASGVFKVSKQSYMQSGNNFGYCLINSQPTPKFAMVGRSASGTGYYYSNTSGGVQKITATWQSGNALLCPLAGIDPNDPNYSFLWIESGSAWKTWVD